MTSAQALLSRLRSKGVELWLRGAELMYEAPAGALTGGEVDELCLRKAELIHQLSTMTDLTAPEEITSDAERANLAPLSFSQLRLWFMAQMEGGDTAYHISLGVRLGG
ncbi:MAG TPA: hypothetical protein VNZ06_10690, partial [Steroidobacteraceae bacterium]|nr:hypothetical protein [Steroidobacteraceae bacterium]